MPWRFTPQAFLQAASEPSEAQEVLLEEQVGLSAGHSLQVDREVMASLALPQRQTPRELGAFLAPYSHSSNTAHSLSGSSSRILDMLLQG